MPPNRAQEILGRADVRTTLAIYTHTMKRKHDGSADKMAELGARRLGDKLETTGSLESQESELSYCFNELPGLESNQRPTD